MPARHHVFTLLATALLGASLLAPAHADAVSLAGRAWTVTGNAGLIGATGTVPRSPWGNDLFGFVSTADSLAADVSPLLLQTDGKGNEAANNGSRVLSGSFAALAGQTLSLQFNYVSTDGRGYDDYAWARLVHAADTATAAWLFTARSTHSARGHVVPGDVLERQQDKELPDALDATLNNGDSVGFPVSSTQWQPLGGSSGYCWDEANTCGPSGWIRSDYTFGAAGEFRLEFGVVNWGDTLFDSALAFDYQGLAQADFPGLTVMAAVPEPETWLMLLSGVGLVGAWARRRGRGSRRA